MPSTLDLAVLDHRVRTLEQRVTELEAARRPARRDPVIDACNLHEGLVAYGSLPESTAVAAYGKESVRYALRHGLACRHPLAFPKRLTAALPTEAGLEAIAEALEHGPQPLAMLRTLPGVSKNTIGPLILRGVHEGHFRRGNVQTGKAGRPQVVVARADRPLPTHWDTHKVDWDRA